MRIEVSTGSKRDQGLNGISLVFISTEALEVFLILQQYSNTRNTIYSLT